MNYTDFEFDEALKQRLDSLYSQNKQGWFPWIMQQCNLQPGMRILELGCGNGALWTENREQLPADL